MAGVVQTEVTEGSSTSLSDGVLFGDFLHTDIVELEPTIVESGSDEGIVVSVVQCSSVNQDRVKVVSVD